MGVHTYSCIHHNPMHSTHRLESVVDELRASGRTLEERLSEAQTQWSAEKEGWSREREKLTQDLSNERWVLSDCCVSVITECVSVCVCVCVQEGVGE